MSINRNPDDPSFMRESWVMKFPDTYSSFLSRSGYSGWNTPTSYAEAAIFSRRKNSKRMAVHADYYYGRKRQGPTYVRVLSFVPAVFKARSSSLYDTFNEGVGPKSNRRFIRAGQIYRMRKGLKLYTYKFVRGYAKGWGYDLR